MSVSVIIWGIIGCVVVGLVGLAIWIDRKPCKHRWPKVKNRNGEGQWVDEWLQDPFGLRSYRKCISCGLTECNLLDANSKPYIAIYDKDGHRVGRREVLG